MSALHELSSTVHTRRAEMGLTQATLAKLSGLSRGTVNQLENGSIHDLSLLRVSRLLDVLGLPFTFGASKPKANQHKESKFSACEIAARTASVSYRIVVSADQLRKIFCGQEVPERYWPHVHTLLEEAPVSLLARVVDELHREFNMDRSEIWQRMRDLARKFKGTRELWL